VREAGQAWRGVEVALAAVMVRGVARQSVMKLLSRCERVQARQCILFLGGVCQDRTDVVRARRRHATISEDYSVRVQACCRRVGEEFGRCSAGAGVGGGIIDS
jgi:hypothetical protein